MIEVLFSERARGRLTDLNPDIQSRIKESLRGITPERDLSPLSGEDVFKFRIGDCRVLVDWDRTKNTVYVLTLDHRQNIYDREW